jgi:hypothetical protein
MLSERPAAQATDPSPEGVRCPSKSRSRHIGAPRPASDAAPTRCVQVSSLPITQHRGCRSLPVRGAEVRAPPVGVAAYRSRRARCAWPD